MGGSVTDAKPACLLGFARIVAGARFRESPFRVLRGFAGYPEVFAQQRSTSATLQAWATQPRGV
jgi:hypothetical protein